jgi:hypothetical protein
MEWEQPFYISSISGRTVTLSPERSESGCVRHISRPPYLAAAQLAVTTSSDTPPIDFYKATTGCTRILVTFRIHN